VCRAKISKKKSDRDIVNKRHRAPQRRVAKRHVQRDEIILNRRLWRHYRLTGEHKRVIQAERRSVNQGRQR
jgi:hypothetical protein